MPTRKGPEIVDEQPIISEVSQSAVAQALGRPVQIDSARDEIEAPGHKPDLVDNFNKAVVEAEKIQVTNTYGTNYYRIDTKSLPTKGVFYGGAEIFLRNFKVVEVKRLAYITEETAGSIINDIMKNVVQGYAWEKIKTADRIAIIFYVRMNTFPDPSYKINYSCNRENAEGKICNTENKMSFTANDLSIKYLPEDFKLSDQTINLPNGDVLTWRFPEIGDEKAINIAAEQIKMSFEKSPEYKGTEVDAELVSVAQLIETVNGATLTPIEKYLYVTEIAGPTSYVIILRELTTKYEIGLDPEVECVCKECGGRVSVPVMFSPEFFLPEYSVA